MSKSIPLTAPLRIQIVDNIVIRETTAQIDDAMDCWRAIEARCYGDVQRGVGYTPIEPFPPSESPSLRRSTPVGVLGGLVFLSTCSPPPPPPVLINLPNVT
ncbi:hypothetical protein TMatcc_006021 [Talaromyces marneffei ATCC 18224]